MRLFSLTLLTILFAGAGTNPVQLTADDTVNIVSKILGSFQGTNTMNLTHLFTSFEMPTCLKRCMPSMDNIGAVFMTAKKPETMKKLCANLTESSKCATAAGCDSLFVGAMTNAFQFMCMDNVDKISVQFACIQESAGDLQQECEAECSVQANAIENARQNKADQLFSMENMCNATSCLAHCYEENLVKYCDIGEGNVIDTIFSQFDSLEDQPGIFAYLKKDEPKKNGVARLLKLVMPNGCDDDVLKIELPKKLPMPDDKPKAVGTPAAKVVKEIPSQKATNSNATVREDALLKAKAGNLSSAAMMINGKVQTLQCQVLDSNGNPQNTPDFQSLSKILAEHFNKKTTTPPPPSDRSDSNEEKRRPCRDVSQQESAKNSGSLTIFWSIFSLIVWKFF